MPIDIGIHLHPNDVVCGRGGTALSHPGNIQFREAVTAAHQVYVTASTPQDKENVARAIVANIKESGGRFLVKISSPEIKDALGIPLSQDLWKLLQEHAINEKVKQALRDCSKTKKKKGATKSRAPIRTLGNLPHPTSKQGKPPPSISTNQEGVTQVDGLEMSSLRGDAVTSTATIGSQSRPPTHTCLSPTLTSGTSSLALRTHHAIGNGPRPAAAPQLYTSQRLEHLRLAESILEKQIVLDRLKLQTSLVVRQLTTNLQESPPSPPNAHIQRYAALLDQATTKQTLLRQLEQLFQRQAVAPPVMTNALDINQQSILSSVIAALAHRRGRSDGSCTTRA